MLGGQALRITRVETTPLFIPYTRPFHWAQGIVRGAEVVLVAVHTDEAVVGYGECIASPSAEAIEAYLRCGADICAGRDPFDNAALMQEVHHALFQACGTCSSPRFAARVLAGLEMALWDAAGKALNQPVHRLLGGAVRRHVDYFGFAQGETANETADEARILAEAGFKVIYVKVGRGDTLDLDIVARVREAVGAGARLRVDANEKWSVARALRMIRRLSAFDIECVEQPTHCESVAALAQVRSASPVAIAADQVAFTPFDAYDVCRERAADLIVTGVHETGGLRGLAKVAAIAEAAGIAVCLHGLYETGITTCAGNQIAATLPNLDDGNQHMTRFLDWDIVTAPNLEPSSGQLPVLDGPGLGFELDAEAVERASALYRGHDGRRPHHRGHSRSTRT